MAVNYKELMAFYEGETNKETRGVVDNLIEGPDGLAYWAYDGENDDDVRQPVFDLMEVKDQIRDDIIENLQTLVLNIQGPVDTAIGAMQKYDELTSIRGALDDLNDEVLKIEERLSGIYLKEI